MVDSVEDIRAGCVSQKQEIRVPTGAKYTVHLLGSLKRLSLKCEVHHFSVQ